MSRRGGLALDAWIVDMLDRAIGPRTWILVVCDTPPRPGGGDVVSNGPLDGDVAATLRSIADDLDAGLGAGRC